MRIVSCLSGVAVRETLLRDCASGSETASHGPGHVARNYIREDVFLRCVLACHTYKSKATHERRLKNLIATFTYTCAICLLPKVAKSRESRASREIYHFGEFCFPGRPVT